MEFRNHTPFPALIFEGTDTRNNPFHVLTLRQTLTWDDDGKLEYADEQVPLNIEDLHFAETDNSIVRQESDLCHFKPHCDVIVNGTAYAPKGLPQRRFNVRLRLTSPNQTVDLPEPPQGLNPLQQPSKAAQQAWLSACESIRQMHTRDRVLLDKTLTVLGERWFIRRFWPRRLLANVVRWGSFGILRPATWRLTNPKKTLSVPIRADLAFGGQCRIESKDKSAKRIAKRHHLKPAQRSESHGFVALEGLQSNPVGRGWVRRWYLKAKRLKRVPAPQIELPGRPVKRRHFTLAQSGKLREATATALIAGLGIRPKVHLERARMIGTVDDDFINQKSGLSFDFDSASWNAAWPDQQTRHLEGSEFLELVNLCHPDTLGVRYDNQSNRVLRLSLPRHDCFALLRFDSGKLREHPLVIDTLIVETDTQTLTLVWRANIKKDPAQSIRAVEARMRTLEARGQLNTAVETLQQLTRQVVNP